MLKMMCVSKSTALGYLTFPYTSYNSIKYGYTGGKICICFVGIGTCHKGHTVYFRLVVSEELEKLVNTEAISQFRNNSHSGITG